MALPITNIPVLTGEVAERFISQCDYNARHLAGSCWSQKNEDMFLAYEERQRQKRKERLSNRNWNEDKDGRLETRLMYKDMILSKRPSIR